MKNLSFFELLYIFKRYFKFICLLIDTCVWVMKRQLFLVTSHFWLPNFIQKNTSVPLQRLKSQTNIFSLKYEIHYRARYTAQQHNTFLGKCEVQKKQEEIKEIYYSQMSIADTSVMDEKALKRLGNVEFSVYCSFSCLIILFLISIFLCIPFLLSHLLKMFFPSLKSTEVLIKTFTLLYVMVCIWMSPKATCGHGGSGLSKGI